LVASVAARRMRCSQPLACAVIIKNVKGALDWNQIGLAEAKEAFVEEARTRPTPDAARVVCGNGVLKSARSAQPALYLRRPRVLVCLAPSPTYVGRVFWCAFKLLAPRLGKKMQPCTRTHSCAHQGRELAS
jgi:hypothetical protein